MVNVTLMLVVFPVLFALYGRVKAWDDEQERRGGARW